MADAEMVQPPSYLNTRDREESRDDEAPKRQIAEMTKPRSKTTKLMRCHDYSGQILWSADIEHRDG